MSQLHPRRWKDLFCILFSERKRKLPYTLSYEACEPGTWSLMGEGRVIKFRVEELKSLPPELIEALKTILWKWPREIDVEPIILVQPS